LDCRGGEGSYTITTAVSMLDRLLHHCHVVVTDGESYRIREAVGEEEPTQVQLNNPTGGAFR
jgi:DNA replication protein DnaC